MDFEFIDPWHAFLPREPGHVLAVIGSGGKTSLLETIHDVLVAEGLPVAVTTTTRTEALDWAGLECHDIDQLAETPLRSDAPAVFIGRGCAAGTPSEDGKWRGLSPTEVDELGATCPERIVLVEADGAAKMPVKLHRDDEPLLPSRTSLVLSVAGLSSIGRPIAEVLHRYGRLPHDRLELDPENEIWDWPAMLKLIAGPGGYLSRVPAEVPQVIALLQLDQCDDAIGFFGFLGELMVESAVPLVVTGDTSGPEPRLRTACPASDSDHESD